MKQAQSKSARLTSYSLPRLRETEAWKNLKQEPMVFTEASIKMEQNASGIWKKKVAYKTAWGSLTASNLREGDEVLIIMTGIRSGLTVVDFDDGAHFLRLCAEHPELAEHYTVRTRKGFHLYCDFNPTLKTTDNIWKPDEFGTYPVDIRNEKGIVFAPPTEYDYTHWKANYSYLRGTVKPVPDWMLDKFTAGAFITSTSVPVSPMSMPDFDDITLSPIKQDDGDDCYEEIKALIQNGDLDKQAQKDGYDAWFKVAIAIRNELPNSRGYELLDMYSQLNARKYEPENNEREWRNLLAEADRPVGSKRYDILTLRKMAASAVPNPALADVSMDSTTNDDDDSVNGLIATADPPRPPPKKVCFLDEPTAPEFPEDEGYVRDLMGRNPQYAELAERIVMRYRPFLKATTNKCIFSWNDGIWQEYGDLGFYNAIKLFCYSFTRIVRRIQPQIPASASAEAIIAAKIALKAFENRAERYRTFMLSNQEKLFPYMMRDVIDHGFYEKLDSKAEECNFNNCIINFETGEIRQRAPTDNCTLCTYSNYVKTGSPEDTEEFARLKDEVMDLFYKIVPGDEERQWLMHTLAARFIGGNRDDKIGFGKGPASNGKSILISLCRLMFGDYQRILPKEVLMGKGNKAGAATPDLALLRGVRLVFAPEPSLTDVLNESLSKTLSGDSEIQVRALYCAPFPMKIMFQIWFMSNHFIRIPADGDGIWRYVGVVIK